MNGDTGEGDDGTVVPEATGTAGAQEPGAGALIPAREIELEPDLAGAGSPEVALVAPAGAHVVEILGPGLRVRGHMRAVGGGRLSDHVNLGLSALHLYEASLIDAGGHAHAVLSEDLFVTKRQVVLIGEPTFIAAASSGGVIPKSPHEIVAIAPGLVITGRIYLADQASVELFLESVDPPFIPLTDVEARSRMGTRFSSHYPFALLNRSLISAMGLRPMGVTSRRSGDPWAVRPGGGVG